MFKINFIFLVFLILLNVSCSKEQKINSVIKEKDLNLQILEAYEEGLKSLEDGDVLYAAKKFNEVEILFPQSEWAPKSAIMAAYAYYIQDYYEDSIAELIRFKKRYPKHRNIDYVNYLLGINYYEQIVDEQKDLGSIVKSKEQFEYILAKFPNTDYALDSKFKLDLINDLLASKEMYVGRYYIERKKWIAEINRFQTVVDKYQTTIYVEEALFRLVEIYYHIGLDKEAKKYANLLGYNYQSSEWYKRSYSFFDENYKKNKKKSKKTTIKKFKSLFE